MEVVGTVMSVAQTLFAALQSAELKEFLSVFGYESQLEELQCTVDTIKAVFQDAERKQTLSAVEKQLIEDLKDAVYEADDLLDEFVTLAEQKQLMKSDGSFSKKMRRFISRRNPFGVAYRMSQGVKKIKKKLDAIAYNKQFSFQHDPEPIRKRRPETCSYVDANDIIGREEDLEKIVAMLLDPDVERDVSLLSIVGIGGLGKTALAQLVYSDPRVTSAFPLRLWTCISDHYEGSTFDQKQLDVKEVLGKILASGTQDKRCEGFTFDQVQSQLRQRLAGNKYLLVLDDVWTEKRKDWYDLAQYLTGGQRGSRIVVTTRSQRTADILGDGKLYEYSLEGLSKEYSWRLFERTAFGPDKPNPPQDLVEIGQGIVAGCARSPLAIRVVGSLLYGQDKKKWQLVHEIGIGCIRANENGILRMLKLSYDHLESPLRSCFSYCAIFPKDYRIRKDMLLSLWMAQGYVVPLDKGQSVEDASEEYFLILLRRCFFQDIDKNYMGDIYSVKIHDLMHDIAQSVSTKEICVSSTIRGNLDKEIRHLSTRYTRECGKYLFRQAHVRSLIQSKNSVNVDAAFVETLAGSCTCLRALDLSRQRSKTCLPDSISTLLHLRYLDLSNNHNLVVLPKSITKLCNLQTLNLESCKNLKELPKEFNKLVKLRALDISFCSKLSYMPTGMDKLSGLYSLSDFIVGSGSSCSSWKHWFGGLRELKALKHLKGCLDIHIKWPKNVENTMNEDGREKELYLRNKEHLNRIVIDFEEEEGNRRMDDEGTIALMEDLHPHPNLKYLTVWDYPGTRMPNWVSLLPNLVSLSLSRFMELEYLPIVDSVGDVSFLPLLEDLELVNLPKLKGFRRDDHLHHLLPDVSSRELQSLPTRLPQLKILQIFNCPELIWMPLCPKLENLDLRRFNKRMVFGEVGVPASTSCEEVGNSIHCPQVREVGIDNVKWLINSPFQRLEHLWIVEDKEVENLGEVGELFRCCSSSLTLLRIAVCPKLRSVVGGGLEHLNALEELSFFDCRNLKLSEEEEKEGEDVGIHMNVMPYSSLLPSLCTLELSKLTQLEKLPKWINFLPALQTLQIHSCRELKAMPDWMPKLTSLRVLDIEFCSKSLEKRCQKEPQGEDWPLIQHIPSIKIEHCF